jgi:NUMOD4 motif-containing protein/HNH endonuclease
MAGQNKEPNDGLIFMREIPGFKDYFATTCGLIYSAKTNMFLSLCKHGAYYVCTLRIIVNGAAKKVQRKVHRLIAITFLFNPDNCPLVNHKNGDKLDNRLENLEWTTHVGNANHAQKLGLVKPSGSGRKRVIQHHPNGTLTAEYISASEAAEITGFNRSCIARVCRLNEGRTKKLLRYKGFTWTYPSSENSISPEEVVDWKDIEGYPYKIASDSRIYGIKARRLLKKRYGADGYAYVDLWVNNNAKRFYVYELVATAYGIPKLRGATTINHKDGVKGNDDKTNLEWTTRSENTIHAMKTGLIKLRPIVQYDLNHNFLCRFTNIIFASEETGISTKKIGQACNRKGKAGEFYWERETV